MVIRGPRPDVSIIFDNIKISADKEEEIKWDLVQNSQFEVSEEEEKDLLTYANFSLLLNVT